jgi:hypothetical protein
LQVWWLFDEVWHFADEKDRKIAARTVEVWNNIAKSYAIKYGYDVDMTHDLARVMRLPGTINAKVVENPVPVKIMSSSDKRYNVSKIKEICADFAITLKGNNTTEKSYVSNYSNINIVVNENANPPFDKFMLLMKNPKFKKSCERNRKDLTDQSPSSYDNSIASFAINAGWTDQEIVDTLIALRRNNNEGNKENRVDYFQRTIGKLRVQFEENMLVNDFKKEQTLDGKVLSQCLETKENELRTINERLGLNIKRIIKYVSDPPIFSLEMEDGKSIKLGEVGNLITQKSFIKNIAAVSGIYVRTRKPAVWDIVAALLLKVCEEVEIGDEATDTGSMAEKIAEYLDTQRVYSDAKEAVNRKKPFYDTINGDEYIMISGKEFRRWATTTDTDKMSNQDMGIVFRKLGLSSVTHRVSDKTYKLWVIPKESPLYIEEKNNDEIIF